MNKRFCKLGNLAAKAFFLTAICGATYSCKDDYTLDDTTPSWLGSSIYEYLEEDGHYSNFVKLINDLEYKEVLARTGSKTLFVANDDAFNSFYSSNPWGVKSYDQLTQSQKKMLLNSAMINNAYLLEMMSSTEAVGGDNAVPVKGECLRRSTAYDVTDTIPHLFADDLPITFNKDDIDYWARFRNSDKGIFLALDGTETMMTHFLAAQLSNKNITDEDFKLITGVDRQKNDAFIFSNKVIKQDITCQNGYINVLDKVNLNPQNMAEVLRTNGDTKIFSHLLDRFSAPFYSQELTFRAKLLYGEAIDSVYEKRYFSIRSKNGANLYNDAGTDPKNNPQGNKVFDSESNKPLPFDPGWNAYYVNDKTSAEQDMAVIFCPNDKKMMEYFFKKGAGGNFLVKAYAEDLAKGITPDETDFNKIYQALDQIPRNTIRALLNNLMKESFCSSVPSKFETIKNSAQDPMFDEKYNYHRDKIEKAILANNGVIFIMDEVITPAEYASVSAPAYVEQDKKIFNYAIQSASLGGIPTNYFAYLLAMSSRFSFFVPQDLNFIYIDPVSFNDARAEGSVLVGKAYLYEWSPKDNIPKIAAYECRYDLKTKTSTLGSRLTELNLDIAGNRLKDMLETHTIIHSDNSESTGIDETATGAECNKHFFITKNGAVLYTENAENRNGKRKDGSTTTQNMTVKGGWLLNGSNQIDANDPNGKNACTVIGFDDKSAQTSGYGNGYAYMIDGPIQPAMESVFSVLYSNKNFSKFFELCQPDLEALQKCDIKEKATLDKFTIFSKRGGLVCYDEDGRKVEEATNVRFFNNYNYSIYIPTNEAIQAAIDKGLPTWDDVRELANTITDADGNELDKDQIEARNKKVEAMATVIINFVKNHFQDNSIFADVTPMSSTVFETATMNSETGVYSKVSVSSNGSKDIKSADLAIKDAAGNVRHITSDKNIIARDYIIQGNKIISSSSAVIHGIDGVLDYKKYTNGRYDSDFSTAARARAYINKYRLTK